MQSDSRLVKLFRRGVEPAFDELVKRYRGALVAYAGAIAGRDRAEDVVQDSLVKAHRSFSGDQSFEAKPWLYAVVRNTALNDIRDNRKHSHDGLGETADRDFQQPHDVAERREELAAVVAAVSALPASQRRALVGHELGGFSYDEIAAELDISPGATKQLIYRARLSLRNGFGALIPFPLIAWLASDTTSVFATGAAGGVASGAAAGGALSASGGAAGTGGGFFAGLAGAGSTKLAVVAIVAGGSIAGGVAVEKHHNSSRNSAPVGVTEATDNSAGTASGVPRSLTSIVAGIGDSSGSGTDSQGGGSQGHPKSDDDAGRPSSGSGEHSGSGGGDQSARPSLTDDHSGSGSGHAAQQPRPEGSENSGPGSGDDRPHASGSGGGDDAPRPPSGSGGSSGSGSSGSSGSGSSGSGSSSSGPGGGDDYHPEFTPLPKPGSGKSVYDDD